jgi:hypothetical protein
VKTVKNRACFQNETKKVIKPKSGAIGQIQKNSGQNYNMMLFLKDTILKNQTAVYMTV